MPAPTLETDRLVLRPFVDEDVDPLLEVYRTPEVRRWLHLDAEPTREDVWGMMAVWRGMWELRGCGQLAVVERATGRVVGRAGTHLPEREDWPGIEVGWALHPDVWGRGYATEAGRASADDAFDRHDVGALYSCILADNTRSQAVAQRLGFAFWEERTMSFFPDAPHGIWRLTREAWAGRRLG